MLNHLQVPHFAYTIDGGNMNNSLIEDRIDWTRPNGRSTEHWSILPMNESDVMAERAWMSKHAEDFVYVPPGRRSVHKDQASYGLSYIVKRARPLGVKIYMSGSGVDE